jgi:hypothetical protein
MERRIIHNKNRIRLWLASIMKKLLDIFFKYKPLSGTLKYLVKKHTILCISRENVIPMIPVEVSNLHGSHTERGPPVRLKPIRLPQPYSSMDARTIRLSASTGCPIQRAIQFIRPSDSSDHPVHQAV